MSNWRNDIVLMDGACGTALWDMAKEKVPVWQYNILEPGIVKKLALSYLDAGTELLLSNTFGVNRLSVEKTPYTVQKVVSAALEILQEAAAEKLPTGSPKGKPARISLDVGPLTQLMEPYGDLEEEEVFAIYDEVFKAALPYHPDYIQLETFIDLSMLEVAVQAASQYNIPILCSMSFEPIGKTMFGNSVEDVVEVLTEYKNVAALGINCSLGPDAAVPIIRKFHELTDLPLIFKPNAGKPDITSGSTVMEFDEEIYVRDSLPALDHGVKFIGGCCGTSPAYIARIRKALGRE